MNDLSRIKGEHEPAYRPGPECVSMSDLNDLREELARHEHAEQAGI